MWSRNLSIKCVFLSRNYKSKDDSEEGTQTHKNIDKSSSTSSTEEYEPIEIAALSEAAEELATAANGSPCPVPSEPVVTADDEDEGNTFEEAAAPETYGDGDTNEE